MILRIRNNRDREAVANYITKLPDGKQYDVNVSQKRQKRTISQNSLYWLWLTCIHNETGNDKDILHREFAKKYLPKKSGHFFDEVVEHPVSTTSLDTKQFTEYLDKIQVFVNAELGIVLPNPEDQIWEIFYETYKDRL
jgi:hypothetical protein